MILPAGLLNRPIAHRCLHDDTKGRPENSWEALDAAIAAGFPVEIDLQLSRDGCAVVFHDDTLDRLTDKTGYVADYTAAELAQIPLKGGKKTIPLFGAFCAYVAGRVPILVELKDQTGHLEPSDGRLEAAACKILNGYDGDAALMSFNPDMMAHCLQFAPDIPRGLITDPFKPSVWPHVPADRRASLAKAQDFDCIDACFISHNRMDLENPIIMQLKSKGAKILCWTVENIHQELMARKIVDNITFEGYIPSF